MTPLAAIGEYPGVAYQRIVDLPPRCLIDRGPWLLDLTGVRCATCRSHFVVGEVLKRSIAEGRGLQVPAAVLGAARAHPRAKRGSRTDDARA